MTLVKDFTKYQLELKEEEDLLVSLLSRIDEQLHALQVERLELLSAKSKRKLARKMKVTEAESALRTHTVIKQELDLNVPITWNEMEEVEEEDSS